MANTTFNGPVRSENGFKTIIKDGTTGGLTNEMTLSTYSTSITIAASGTDHKESSIGIPSNFIPMGVAITVTSAAANAVNLVDIGTDADTDGFVDGISVAINSTGFKGFCNYANLKTKVSDVGNHVCQLVAFDAVLRTTCQSTILFSDS